ncbi:MAG: hypothetical protein ACOC0N_09335 [Chroococcales cyanobacterium]
MSVQKLNATKANHPFIGTWHIYEMSQWDEDYFNMETQAYVEIQGNNLGSFQFGLVYGSLKGYLEEVNGQQRFSFTWEGNAEMDEAMGSGWLQLDGDNELEGFIKFHLGDNSTFRATKAS